MALHAVCEREAPDLGQVRNRMRADDEEEDRKASAVHPPEEVGMRAGDDEPDAAAQQSERRADNDRRDAAEKRPRRALRPVGGVPCVVAEHPPSSRRELEQDERDECDAERDVPRKRSLQPKEQGPELGEDADEQESPEQRGQVAVAARAAGEAAGHTVERYTNDLHGAQCSRAR